MAFWLLYVALLLLCNRDATYCSVRDGLSVCLVPKLHIGMAASVLHAASSTPSAVDRMRRINAV